MSNANTRNAIAAAMGSVPGIKGYAHRPNGPRAGDAWPQWGGGQRDDQSVGFLETWRVMVVTDQGAAYDADQFLDEKGDAVLAALATILFVDSYAPAKLETETGDMYALMITGRTE
jgi:hypothetical protein